MRTTENVVAWIWIGIVALAVLAVVAQAVMG